MAQTEVAARTFTGCGSNHLFVLLQSAAQRASLLLVDRTLDLTGPASRPVDSLADRMLSLLPHLPQHTSDVCVDMSPISNTTTPGYVTTITWATYELYMTCVLFFIHLRVILPGCLAQPQSVKAQQLLKTLIQSKQKVRCTHVAEPSLKALLSSSRSH